MTYHQKAIVCTSDDKGQGKAVYWEDDNGKITKKTKKFKSPDEMENIYQKFGFEDPLVDMENFMNFNIPSPFRLLSGFADNFFGGKSHPVLEEPHSGVLPDDVDVEKHRLRLKELQEKKKQEEAQKQKQEEDKKYLQSQLEELKNIQKELKKENDEEGVKSISEDIKKIEEKLSSLQ